MNIIPLGNNCLVAEHLKRLGLRKHSLPFDWIYSTDYESLISIFEVIEDDFKDFFNYSIEIHNKAINDGNAFTRNEKYNLSYYHQNYMNIEDGASWRENLADSIDLFRELTKHQKVTFVYSSAYSSDIAMRFSYFKTDLVFFEAMCKAKGFNAHLVILSTIKKDATIDEKIDWKRQLDDYEKDTNFITWRRLVIDDTDGVWGSTHKFEKALKGIVK